MKIQKPMFFHHLIFDTIVDISTMQSTVEKIFENAGAHRYQGNLLSIFICRSLFGAYRFRLQSEKPEILIVESTTGRI